jgi:hypothetical protein
MESLAHLGFPGWLATLLGVYKLLAAVALIFGARWPRVQEWAFAGLFFDLSGAVIAHAVVGDGIAGSAPAGILLVLTGMTYVARQAFPQHRASEGAAVVREHGLAAEP